MERVRGRVASNTMLGLPLHDAMLAGEILGQGELVILVVPPPPTVRGVHPVPVGESYKHAAVLWLGGDAVFPGGVWGEGERRLAIVRGAKRGASWAARYGLGRSGESHRSRQGVAQARVVTVGVLTKAELVPLKEGEGGSAVKE